MIMQIKVVYLFYFYFFLFMHAYCDRLVIETNCDQAKMYFIFIQNEKILSVINKVMRNMSFKRQAIYTIISSMKSISRNPTARYAALVFDASYIGIPLALVKMMLYSFICCSTFCRFLNFSFS